ncbi:YciI family protein [Nodosilinea nodulosa]|uniref:YciI family protein n=1 Tax=Nodosilinea nodulosa TaxID=416001 RepID=UPI0002FDC60A|nr:YciI family protein [Nodosilinea nodulosa]
MQYAIMVYEPEQEFAKRSDATHQEAYWGAYQAYSQALAEAGVASGGTALHPPHTSTTLWLEAGHRKVQDGPYADTKEQLGGMFIVDVPNLDVALDWAARCPAATTGRVEVRPLLPMDAG